MPNYNIIKILALVFMFLDHLGAYLFPQVEQLRILGRFAFPLFAYFVAYGYIMTSNLKKYALRLFLIATIWQIFYIYFIHIGEITQQPPFNVLYTLLLGLYLCYLLENQKDNLFIFILCISFIADVLGFGLQYGTYGLIIIALCFLFFFYVHYLIASTALLSLTYVVFQQMPLVQICAPFAYCFLFMHHTNIDKYFKTSRYFFYAFYPLHILAIMGVKQL